VKIIDLGLAKGATEDALSIAGGFVGTPVYTSPEQFAGLGTDIRSDLYSLGVTLWEMLSGKVPFSGSAAELMDQHQHAAPPVEKLRNVPAPVIALLQVLLAKDPSQRFQNPAQLQQAVARVREAIASGSGLTADELKAASEPGSARSPKAKPRKQTIRWVVGSGLCVAAAATAWFFFFGRAGFLFNRPFAEAVPTKKSVAVLPFESLSENKSDAYFADGVQDEILNNLAKIAQLKVISRTSVMQYRPEAKRNLRQIAADLGVANVLEGTVRRDGNHVRVSTELVDARNDHTIWADSYDREFIDIFAMQSEIAQTVASRLSAQLSPEERKYIDDKPTNNPEAYDVYLQAKQLVKSWWPSLTSYKENYLRAINLLEEATRKDRGFAVAYCLMANVHDSLFSELHDYTPERLALADAAMNEALRLRPDLPEVHLALATHLYLCYRDYERARVQLAIAAQALPNNADLLKTTAFIDRRQGRWEKATDDLERASALDPLDSGVLRILAGTYAVIRRYRDAERVWNRIVELKPDQQPMLLLEKASFAFEEKADLKSLRAAYEGLPPSMKDETGARDVYLYMCGRDFAAAEEILSKSPHQEIIFVDALVPRQIYALWLELVQGNHPTLEENGAAREQLNRKCEADPTNPFLLSALGLTDVALGHKDQAIEEARRAMQMRPISEDAVDGPVLATNFVLACTWGDDLDSAFKQLNILIKIRAGLTYGDLKTNPGWDPLRKDPRFDKLLAELAPRD
jgi:TolB-like protein/Tfp pilus assembly protein PilF